MASAWHLRPARLRAAFAGLLLAVSIPAACPAVRAEQRPDSRDPYVAAAEATGVPLELLVAVAGTESAYHPWAVNLAGKEIYCRSMAEAERLVALSEDVDVGLMQINFHRWGRWLGLSRRQLLDPRINLLAGARILRQCLMGSGELWHRIGAYHSSRPEERQRYNQEVYRHYLRYLRGELH